MVARPTSRSLVFGVANKFSNCDATLISEECTAKYFVISLWAWLAAQDVLPLLKKLQSQRALSVAPGVAEGASGRIAAALRILRTTHAERKACLKRIEWLLKDASKKEQGDETHRDAELPLSLPGLGKRNGAAMLAEATTALQERDYQAIRRLSGTAPVSKRTGGRNKRPMVATMVRSGS